MIKSRLELRNLQKVSEMNNLKKYSFNKYLSKYKQRFSKEKYKLKKILPQSKIEHVGSTSIEGLGGKGIIDIAISIPKKEIQDAIKKLQKKDYEFRPSGGDKERIFFQRKITYMGKERRVHIQLTYDNSKAWKSMIAVRNYLRKHTGIFKEYVQIKKDAIKYAKGNGKKYREYKKNFLQKIEKSALKEYYK